MPPDEQLNYVVRLAEPADAAAYRDYLAVNAEHHAPFVPTPGPDWLDVSLLAARFVPDPTERRIPFVAVAADGKILGQAALSNVVRGAFQSTHLGYSVDHWHSGRGIATRLVRYVVSQAFGPLELHRVEAGTLLDNEASQVVLRRAGFVEYGISSRHLCIAGEWQDHRLYALTVEAWHDLSHAD